MHHDLEMPIVQPADHAFRIRKDIRIEGERTMPRIPARRTKACSEIDQRVAGQLFLAKSLCLAHDLVLARKCSVRLLVTQRPDRRQMREARQLCITVQYLGHRIAHNQIDIAP